MLRGRMRPFVILKAPALPRTVIFFFFTRFGKLRSLLLVDPNYAHFWPRIIMNLQDPGGLTAIITFPNAAGPFRKPTAQK